MVDQMIGEKSGLCKKHILYSDSCHGNFGG